jgi:polar amino acid transport system substrate-binding protein
MRLTRMRAAAAALALAGLCAACSSASSSASGGSSSPAAGTTSGGSSSPAAGTTASLHSLLPKAIQSAGVINWAVEQHPPYMVVNGSNATGPNIDIENALAAALGVSSKISIVSGGPTPVLLGLSDGRYDAFSGPIEATPAHEQSYDLVSYLIAQPAYVTEPSVTSINQLCGTTVAYITGSDFVAFATSLSTYCKNSGKGAVKTLAVADTNSEVLAVQSGRAAGALTTLDAADATVKTATGLKVIIQEAAAGGGKLNNCFITGKSSGLGPALQKAMQQIVDNGTYKQILAKYDLTPAAVSQVQLNPPHSAA